MDWTSMVTVGHIRRPHGNRGHVRIAPETDFAEDRFREGAVLYQEQSNAVEPLVVVASRAHARQWVVGFANIDSIDAAESLRGQELRVPGETLRRLGPGAFYVHDLVGCVVRTVAGELVGPVEKVDLSTGIPGLVVAAEGEVLVPFVDAICRRVDVEGKVIEIDPPEGLIDLNRKPGGRR